jgi:hypothetical protein
MYIKETKREGINERYIVTERKEWGEKKRERTETAF